MWLGVFAARAVCPEDPSTTIQAHAAGLELAFEEVDDAAFARHYAALQEAGTCITAPLEARTILAWHRARGLGEFFEREEIASAKSWAAVKALDPDYALPDEWIVAGTSLHNAWTNAEVTEERIELERSPLGGWRVDGSEASSVPADRAFVLQGFDAAGVPVHTDYHYSVAEVPVVDFAALDLTARHRRRRRVRTIGTVLGTGLGAASLGTLVTAWGQEIATKSEKTDLAEVPNHAQRANTLSSVGLGLGGAGAGVMAITWAVRW